MHPYFTNYQWKKGRPAGLERCEKNAHASYRIVHDPYHKWISIEAYQEGCFAGMVYDSHLLDFRLLKPAAQIGWRKEAVNAHESWIFNEDDRLILREKRLDASCAIFSPHGMYLCRYVFLKEEARVVLQDAASRPVLVQQYSAYDRGEFQELLSEDWMPSTEAYSSAQMLSG